MTSRKLSLVVRVELETIRRGGIVLVNVETIRVVRWNVSHVYMWRVIVNMFSEPKFYNNNGELTAYALACGYIEIAGDYKLNSHSWAILYHEHGHYHVKYSVNEDMGYTERWDFTTLAVARKYFRQVSRQVRKALAHD